VASGASYPEYYDTVEECAKRCAHLPDCKAFDYTNPGGYQGKACRLWRAGEVYPLQSIGYEGNAGVCKECPNGWLRFGQNCYKSVSQSVSWSDAESSCNDEGGNLASVHSVEENQFISTISGPNTWLGGSDAAAEGEWSWSDGSSFDWTPSNWGAPNPEPNGGTSENCLITWGSGQAWNDGTCSKGWWATKFVCKKSL